MTLDPEQLQLAQKLLELSLELGIDSEVLLKLLLSGPNGVMFYQTFQSLLCPHLARYHDNFIPKLIDTAQQNPVQVSCTCVAMLCDCIIIYKLTYLTSLSLSLFLCVCV